MPERALLARVGPRLAGILLKTGGYGILRFNVQLFGEALSWASTWIAVIGVLNSAVSLYYYARIVKAMYLEKADDGAPALAVGRPSAAILAALAAPTLVLGVWWAPLAGVIDNVSSLLR